MTTACTQPHLWLRVVQVIASLDPTVGGPPVCATQTALALGELGIESNEFVFLHERSPEAGERTNAAMLIAAGVPAHGFPLSRLPARLAWRWAISARQLAWLVRRARQFDVLHMHGGWTFTALSGLFVARVTGRVAVLSTHESLTDFDRRKSRPLMRLAKRVLRPLYLRAFDVVVVSSSLEQRDSGDAEGRWTIVIPHAVEIGGVPERRSHPRFRIGYLGRLHPKKNVPLLLEALATLDNDIELVVAGDSRDDYRDVLRRMAERLGVADRVTWLGFVDAEAKCEFLASVDVVAMPSVYECFGMAAAEALAAGVPVVVTPTVGIADTVAAYRAGLVVSPTGVALAGALRRFASEPEFREACARAAEAAAAEHSLARHGERLIAAYDRAAASRRRGRTLVGVPT